MLKDIKRKVMQIANRLVGQGKARTEAMLGSFTVNRQKNRQNAHKYGDFFVKKIFLKGSYL